MGAQLFISPRTIGTTYARSFLKLDIGSRNQLGRVPPSHLSLG
ncbi:MAG: hypothetical protein WB297_08475 [Actinomycetota bacterium]